MGFVSDFFDDVVGMDPSGGGLHDIERNVFNYADPVGVTLNLVDNGFNIDSWNAADNVMGFDPNGGGAIKTANFAAPLVAAYFTGGLSGLGDAGAASGGIWDSLAANGLDSGALTSALTDAGISSTADASAFGSALADSGWGQYLASYAGNGVMGDVSTSGLFGAGAGTGTGLGNIYGTVNGIGDLVNGIGSASPTILGNTANGVGNILGSADGVGGSIFDGLMNKGTLNNLAKAYKAFTSQNPSGTSKTGETIQGVLNSILMGAELGKSLTGKNGIDVNTLKTHDVVAPNGPNFKAAMATRRAKGKV